MKYKVGDKVVIRKPKEIDNVEVSWVKEMNKYVDKEYTIEKISEIYYKMEGIRFLWKKEWLEDPFETLVRKLQ